AARGAREEKGNSLPGGEAPRTVRRGEREAPVAWLSTNGELSGTIRDWGSRKERHGEGPSSGWRRLHHRLGRQPALERERLQLRGHIDPQLHVARAAE